jgi:hypothetical protein
MKCNSYNEIRAQLPIITVGWNSAER